jgi:hypothetical protein
MRRLPVLLLATALSVPAATVLPVVGFPTSGPAPVPPSITAVALTGVDAGALAGADHGDAAARIAAEQADAIGPPAALARRMQASGTGAASGTGVARTIVLTQPQATEPFSSLGVTWDLPARGARPDLVVVVRTHGPAGWSAWTPLETEDAELTDATGRGPQRAGTAPLWADRSDRVQVRVDLRGGPAPTGLRAELIDPGSSGYDGQVGVAPPGSAAAQAGTPTIYSRAQWGADERRVRSAPTLMPGVAAAVIHHTTDRNTYTAAQVPAIIRADYAYHLSRGWNDIGYNFLVDRFGRIWEGRRGGTAAAVQGAHAGGFNFRTFGVSVIGNYETASASTAVIGALQRLIAWKLDLAHADPQGTTSLTAADSSSARWPAGTVVRRPVIMGHRDVGYTACPGAKLYPQLNRIRVGVAALIGAALTNPSVTSTTARFGGGGPTVTAGTLTRQSWALKISDCRGQGVASVSGTTSRRQSLRTGWNGRVGGAPARPGIYDLRLDSKAGAATARPITSSFLVQPPGAQPAPIGPAATGTGDLVPVTPVRLLDSRSGPVLATGAGGRVDVTVTGRGGIPADGVLAVALTLTAVCPSSGTYLTVWPAGGVRPGTSNLNLPARGLRTASVIVPVGAQGQVSIGNAAGVADVVIDAVGYTSASTGTGVLPTAPLRSFDTRTSGGPLPASSTRTVSLPELAGVPADRIRGVVAQISATGATRGGWLEAHPASAGFSGTTTLTYEPGTGTVVLAVLAADRGRFVLTNQGSAVEVAIDVVAVITDDPVATRHVTALTPSRVHDSRRSGGPLPIATVRDITVAGVATGVPDDAVAVLVGLTVVAGGVATDLTAWASGQVRPASADLQVAAGGVRANLALVPLGPNGRISLRASGGACAVIVDVVGYLR